MQGGIYSHNVFHLPLFALTLFRTKSKTASSECENVLWIKGFFSLSKMGVFITHFLMRYQNLYKTGRWKIACDSEDWSNDCWKFSFAIIGINWILKYIQTNILQYYCACCVYIQDVCLYKGEISSLIYPAKILLQAHTCTQHVLSACICTFIEPSLVPLSVSLNYLSTSGSFKLLLSSTRTDI